MFEDQYIGVIAIFGGNFAPQGWAFCNGQLASVPQNTALFSILGTTYGGDGVNTFGLPYLRGRVAIHAGSGPGLSSFAVGDSGGSEQVTISPNQLATHSHSVLTLTGTPGASSALGTTDLPSGNYPATVN